jgi:hypothetical protein
MLLTQKLAQQHKCEEVQVHEEPLVHCDVEAMVKVCWKDAIMVLIRFHFHSIDLLDLMALKLDSMALKPYVHSTLV